MVGAWQGRGIPRLNNAVEPPRRRRDKGGETVERSSAMALNGVDSLSLCWLGSFLLFSLGFGCLSFFMFVFESHVSDMCLFR